MPALPPEPTGNAHSQRPRHNAPVPPRCPATCEWSRTRRHPPGSLGSDAGVCCMLYARQPILLYYEHLPGAEPEIFGECCFQLEQGGQSGDSPACMCSELFNGG